KNRKLSLHSKIVLIATAVLLCSGTVFYLVAEWNNTLADMNFGYKLLNAFFMAVTPRTAGYCSVDLTKMTLASRFFTILLMFIGASPASTGGGIKTTTAVILLFAIFSGVNNQNKIILNKRYINSRIILRAVALSVFFVLLICLSTIILMLTESNNMALQAAGSYNLETLFFETVSALSTVGLTLNATPLLSVGGKIIIMITMFMGRVGPLTIGLIFLKKIRNTAEEKIRYPEAMIMIG
ncbi:MAG TPA: potassium transporter TrkG, partial [Clostridia bacterium]